MSHPYHESAKPETPLSERIWAAWCAWWSRNMHNLVGLAFMLSAAHGCASSIVNILYPPPAPPVPTDIEGHPVCPPAPACPGPTPITEECDTVCGALGMRHIAHQSTHYTGTVHEYTCQCIAPGRACSWGSISGLDCEAVP